VAQPKSPDEKVSTEDLGKGDSQDRITSPRHEVCLTYHCAKAKHAGEATSGRKPPSGSVLSDAPQRLTHTCPLRQRQVSLGPTREAVGGPIAGGIQSCSHVSAKLLSMSGKLTEARLQQANSKL